MILGKDTVGQTLPSLRDRPQTSGPYQAPALPAYHVPREAELADLRRVVLGARSIALEPVRGMRGIGATTLAISLCHDQQVVDHFPDGILWAALGPGSTLRTVLVDWGRALPTDHALFRMLDTHRQADLVREWLADRRCLLVLDGAVSSEQVTLNGRHTTTLIITHRPDIAAQAEVRRTLGVMHPDEAVDLIQNWAGDDDAPRPVVSELAWRFGYQALPLTLVGARVRSSRSWGRVLRSIERAGVDLSDPEQPQAERHAWLHTTFAISLGVQPMRRQRRFAQLGQLGPTFTFEQAAALWGLGGDALPEAQHDFHRLREAALLTDLGGGQHSIHTLLHRYVSS